MCSAPSSGSDPSFKLEVIGTPETVRDVLAQLRRECEALGLGPDQCGTIEIALAEALNNIVEHAYAPACEGPLWLKANLTHHEMKFELRDRGAPLPGLKLPIARLPDATGEIESLPEGGFGWFLIHDLTETLKYSHDAGENCLCLSFAINPDES